MAMSSSSLPLGTSEGANMAFNSSVSSPTSTSEEDSTPNVPLFTNLQMNKRRYLGGEAGSSSSKLASSWITINHLPDELLLEIFSYMDVAETINILRVCRRWEILAQEACLWRHKKYVVRKDTSEEEAIATFAALPQLRTVIVEKTVSPEVLQALSMSCPHLTTLELDVDHMLRYSEAVELFDRCKKIRTLAVSNYIPQLDEHFVDAVARLADLRVLHLKRYNDYTCEEIPLRTLADGCPHLCDLEMLDLFYNFEDAEYFISTHKHVLKSLYINWRASNQRNIVPLLPACAETLEGLELVYYCSGSHAESAEIFAALGQLHNLRHLGFDVTEWEGEHLVPALFENGRLAKLQWLQFEELVTDETIRAVVENCPELRELTLRRCGGHTDTLFEWLCRHEKLETLKIDYCCAAGRAMSYIAKLPALHTLEFYCTEFDYLKPGVDCILEMSGLRRLCLRDCTCSAIPFDKFPGRLVNLRELEVESSKVDPFVVGEIQARMPDLRVKIC